MSFKTIKGKKIIVTRAALQARPLVEKLSRLGAEVLNIPVIRIEPVKGNEERFAQEINAVSKYQWLVFTSVNSVRIFFDLLKKISKNIMDLKNVRVYAVGSVTKNELEKRGVKPVIIPKNYTMKEVFNELLSLINPQDKILVLQAENGKNVLKSIIKRYCAEVTSLPLYRTVTDMRNKEMKLRELKKDGIEWITFTSPSTVKSLLEIIKDEDIDFNKWKTACIGPVTERAAKKNGFKVKAVAKIHTCDGLVEGILNYYRSDKYESDT